MDASGIQNEWGFQNGRIHPCAPNYKETSQLLKVVALITPHPVDLAYDNDLTMIARKKLPRYKIGKGQIFFQVSMDRLGKEMTRVHLPTNKTNKVAVI